MDCEQFDRVVLDWLYEELGDIESAATQRHVAHCNRCRRIASQLKAAREVGLVPLQPVSDELFARVLEAERAVQAALPVSKRLGRFVSVVAGWSMRPQIAMGALLLLTISGGLALLRGGSGASSAEGITESGVPEQPQVIEPISTVPAAEAPLDSAGIAEPRPPVVADASTPAATAATTEDDAQAPPGTQTTEELEETTVNERYDAALSLFRAGSYSEAREGFDVVARSASPKAPHAQLLAARALSHSDGCAVAIPRYEALATALKQPELANEALWLAAECQRELKRWDAARSKYVRLRSVSTYGARADQALQAMKRAESSPADAGAAAPTAPSPSSAQ